MFGNVQLKKLIVPYEISEAPFSCSCTFNRNPVIHTKDAFGNAFVESTSALLSAL